MNRYIDLNLIGELIDSHGNVHYEDLQNLPTVNVRKNVRGKWVKLTGMMPPELFGRHQCSKCDEFALHDWKHHKEQLTDFCPNCGADMRGEDDE